MSLLSGRNWVYLIHIFLLAPLLLYISIGYLFNLKGNDNLYKLAMWSLAAFSIVMVGYHSNKLMNNE